MKKLLSLVLAACLAFSAIAVAMAAEPYDYPTKDFFSQPIPEPKASYIPDGTPIISMVEYSAAPNFDSDAFINSEYGEQSSINLKTSYAGYTPDVDEALLAYWKGEGVIKEGFGLENEDKADNYFVYTPADMDANATYPLLIVSHGGGSNCFAVEGMGFINLIPTEKFILATAENTSTDNLYAMYQAVTAAYPVDKSRVYATGTSAGGMASVSLAVAYPELVAAIAPNDIGPSLNADGEKLAKLKELGMPMNYTTGLADKYNPYPVKNVDGYNRLLSAFGFEAYAVSAEESAALVSDSMNILERATGLSFPNVELVKYVNNRLYVADFVNDEGVTMLRINVVENKPHMFVGYDAVNAWNFMKQFSRNIETGELIVK